MLETIEKAEEKVADTRRKGFDLKFKLTDAIKKCLCGVLFKTPISIGFPVKNERTA